MAQTDKQEIYGWHIIHNETGLPYAFCCKFFGNSELEEKDVLDGMNPDEFTLIPLCRMGVVS